MADLFIFYGPVAILSAINQVFIKLAYALGKTTFNAILMVISLPFYVLTFYLFQNSLGIQALGLSLLIYNFMILLFLLIGILKFGKNKINFKVSIKSVVSFFVLVSILIITAPLLHFGDSITQLILSGLFYFPLYLVLIYFTDKELRILTNRISLGIIRRLKNKKTISSN